MISDNLEMSQKTSPNFELLQKQHYEKIAKEYDSHYNDVYSQKYLQQIAFEQMFAGIDLQNKSVLEAMCGGGQTTKFLLDKNAQVTGLDISPQQLSFFQNRHPQAGIICSSMLNSGLKSESFDVVSIVGGIHHLPPNVNEGIFEIHRILKSGGYLCFMEPHNESFAQRIRQIWYKYDPLFAKNEEAIDMRELRKSFNEHFEFQKEWYLGNVGYLLVLNSMVFRIPIKVKPLYSPFVIKLEKFLNKILGKKFSCFVATQWRKK